VLAWIFRGVLFVAALVTGLFVSRDALNFGVMQMLVAIMLIVGAVMAAAVWTIWRTKPAAGRSGD
jgi:hypothetical protein